MLVKQGQVWRGSIALAKKPKLLSDNTDFERVGIIIQSLTLSTMLLQLLHLKFITDKWKKSQTITTDKHKMKTMELTYEDLPVITKNIQIKNCKSTN